MELVSCQPPDDFLLPGVLSFNALMSLSCYVAAGWRTLNLCEFQCPHGLELLPKPDVKTCYFRQFQCPLGLIPHFYIKKNEEFRNVVWVSMPSRAYTSFLPYIEPCTGEDVYMECQCPLGLIPHFYVPLQKPRFYAVSRACFCRYLSEYSDNRCFSCMLTFWTYLMRCTYPWHWI